jgi:folate-dependent phosphoribosylglycinamide formyltransferase PurN
VLAFYFIKNKNIKMHQYMVYNASFFSLLFLLNYVFYHLISENTKYGDEGLVKYIYLFILFTHIVLAGFLLKVPDNLIQAYNNKIVNIHPALLPAYGGKGMYGEHVHQAVIQAGEKESGITIHLVDEEYDHGKTLFQAKVNVDPNDTPASLAEKVHRLEHEHYPAVIEKWVSRTS